jgi:cytochrome P450
MLEALDILSILGKALTMLPPDDLLSPEAVRDPQGFFRRLREHDPVFWSNRHKVWILTGYHEVERVFQDRSMSTALGDR